MLLLWLSMVCMIPFEMSRLDGQIDAGSGKRPIVDRIIDTAQVGQSVTNCILRLAVFVILSDVFNLFFGILYHAAISGQSRQVPRCGCLPAGQVSHTSRHQRLSLACRH